MARTLGFRRQLTLAGYLLALTTALAGDTPDPFEPAAGAFTAEADGKYVSTYLGRTTTGTLEDGSALITYSAPDVAANVGIQSILKRPEFNDTRMTWAYQFRDDGKVTLTYAFAGGSTGTMTGTYETDGTRVRYRGQMRFSGLPGIVARARGFFRLQEDNFVLRDRVVLPTQTIRTKQIFER